MKLFKRMVRVSLAAMPMLTPLGAGAGTLTTLHVFTGGGDGANPLGPMVYVAGMLYGTTYGYSTVFGVNPDTGAEKILHVFGTTAADGTFPVSGLIAENGILYGTAAGGGAQDTGIVFSLDPASGVYTILHTFNFRRNGKFQPHDGQGPGALTYKNGHLYGTTQDGGMSLSGTIFRVNPAMGFEKVVHSFLYFPTGNLAEWNGVFYGMSFFFGDTGLMSGPIYSFDAQTGIVTTLYRFPMDSNLYTSGGLLYHEGNLYGVEVPNYPAGHRVVFQINAKTGAETTLYTFPVGANGPYSPTGPLVYYHGDLYGGIGGGGKSDLGFVFKLKLATDEATVLYNFNGVSDGGAPNSGLTEHNGIFYGTTFGYYSATCDGAPTACGTVFKITP